MVTLLVTVITVVRFFPRIKQKYKIPKVINFHEFGRALMCIVETWMVAF